MIAKVLTVKTVYNCLTSYIYAETTMWSVAQVCRCTPLALRAAPDRLLVTTKSGFTNTMARQLVTPASNNSKFRLNNLKGLKVSTLIV